MLSSRTGLPRRPGGRSWSVRAGLAILGLLASTGCQVEYAGMTLPSGKYFHDDVQYFAPGPEFPYANTQAATQRARMQAAGIPVPPVPGSAAPTIGGAGIGPGGVPVAPAYAPGAIPKLGAAPEAENSMPGGPSAPNTTPPPPPTPGPAVPGGAAPGGAAPGGAVPAPPG
jgi:hypothetical protein